MKITHPLSIIFLAAATMFASCGGGKQQQAANNSDTLMNTTSNSLSTNRFMNEAIKEALEGIRAGHGGPFGSVIVKDGKIIGRGHNHVLANNDPTCHGEVDAIRSTCKSLGTYDLSGCELYTTGEPCPMCLCACMWANISKVYYGCTIADNEAIGFRDARFDDLLGGREKINDYLQEIDREACLKLFEEYRNISDHVIY